VKSLLVAIVDDDEALRSSVVDLMRAVGHRAEPFTSGEALLASSSLQLFDCIIADIHMPGMSGPDLVRTLRQWGATTPAILITAQPDRHLDDESISAGAHSLLRKPFQTQTLLDRVERSLANEHPER
jgi:FixJ family two-component response regulator